MITFLSGNLFDLDADFRVNPVNCVGVMGKGIALSFKERYPDMFALYREYCYNGDLYPGGLYVWKNPVPPNETVINMATKSNWRNPSKFSFVADGIENLRKFLIQQPIGSVVTIPAIGCGCGELSWDRVKPELQRVLQNLEQNIYVYSPR